jgi:type IX secretion system PorP/SprF family membrane protein
MIRYINILFLAFLAKASFAQDIHFSQYLQAPLLVNPGSTGLIEGNHRFITNYKTQWKSMDSPYKTMSFSYDCKLFKSRQNKGAYLGLGLFAFQDQSGDGNLAQTQFNLSTSGILPINTSNTISLGLQGGFSNRSVSPDAFRWGNQYDGINYNGSLSSNETFVQTTHNFWDVSTGIVWQFRQDEQTFHNGNELSKFDIGISFSHLNRPEIQFLNSEDRLNRKLALFGTMDFEISDSPLAIVSNVYFIKQGPLKEFVLGSMLKYYLNKRRSRYTGFGKQSAIYLGAQYRWKDAFIPTIMVEKEGFSLGMSFDFSTSMLNQISRKGGFEIVLKYTIFNKSSRFSF